MGNEHELVADVDAQTLIKLVKFLKRGKAPGPDTIHNEVLRLGTTTSLFHHLARLFTSSIQLGYIPTAWKLATLRMLLKPDKLPQKIPTLRQKLGCKSPRVAAKFQCRSSGVHEGEWLCAFHFK